MWSLSAPCFLLTLSVSVVLNTTLYNNRGQFGYFSGEEPFLTLRNIPVQKCVTECQLRNACNAVNYWRQRRVCEMLLTDEGSLIQQNASDQVCTYIKKSDVQPLPSIDMSTCSTCDKFTVCNVSASSCQIKECRRLRIHNAVVYGNMLQVGSRVKIVCNSQFTLSTNQSQSVCQSDGSWDNEPTCIINSEPTTTAMTTPSSVSSVPSLSSALSVTSKPTPVSTTTEPTTTAMTTPSSVSSVPSLSSAPSVTSTSTPVSTTTEPTTTAMTTPSSVSSVPSLSSAPSVTSTPTPVSTTTETCPAKWFQIEDTCYFYPDEEDAKTDVFSAMDYCHGLSGYLVEFKDQNEEDVIVQYLHQKYLKDDMKITVWIGLTDNGTESSWRWNETNENVTYVNWAPNQPNGHLYENYARINPKKKWTDNPWNASFQPLCEKSLVSP